MSTLSEVWCFSPGNPLWSTVSCIVVSVFLGFTYLRYTTYKYSASATIKIIDEKESKKLTTAGDVSSEGLFTDGTNKIKDEIETLQSRTLIENVVKQLNLNIACFTEGSIKQKEIYRNPPVKLSFFASDSVIHHVDTILYIKVKCDQKNPTVSS